MTTEPVKSVIRVLVVDDQRVVRDGLTLLVGLLDGIEVVGCAADGSDALRQVVATDPDVILMDLNMPGMGGVQAIAALTERRAHVHAVVLTTYHDDDLLVSALQAGAIGFLTKDCGASVLGDAIRAAANGHSYLEPVVQRRLIDILTSTEVSSSGGPRPIERAAEKAPSNLTPRELEVLRLVAQGKSNGQIAAALSLSLATIKTHINHLLSKTRSADRVALVIYAHQHGLPLLG